MMFRGRRGAAIGLRAELWRRSVRWPTPDSDGSPTGPAWQAVPATAGGRAVAALVGAGVAVNGRGAPRNRLEDVFLELIGVSA